MIFSPKVQTIGSVKDFLGRNPVEKIEGIKVSSTSEKAFLTGIGIGFINQLPLLHLAVPAMATGIPTPVLATIGMTARIVSAFNPLIQLVQGLSYPVGIVMMLSGFLVIMTGNKQKGLNMIKWAAIGYVGMQFAPAIMAILVEIGQSLGK
jgi:hypothetical protein